MNELKIEQFIAWLEQYDFKDNMTSPKITQSAQFQELQNILTGASQDLGNRSHCVVGIDILGYSQIDFQQQAYIPALFDLLLGEAIQHTKETEYLVFQQYTSESIRERFIPTGDGGFLIFETPLQGLFFALNFAAILQLYNAHSFHPGLRFALGPIRMRYCLTYNRVYKYRQNYFGPAIILNARIMSRDKLDRCLLDEGVIHWFLEKFNGIESLRVFNIRDMVRKLRLDPFVNLPEGSNYFLSWIVSEDLKNDNVPKIMNLISQKIGIIKAKEQAIAVYNLYVQLAKSYYDETYPQMTDNYVINLGNLNSSGLTDERNGT